MRSLFELVRAKAGEMDRAERETGFSFTRSVVFLRSSSPVFPRLVLFSVRHLTLFTSPRATILGDCSESTLILASHADVLRGSSRVPAPRTSAELKYKFLSHCSQISAGDHMQIIGDPSGADEVKVLTSQTHMFKLCRV